MLPTTWTSPDTLILTPNQRLSARLKQQHDEASLSAGLTVWPALKALPFNIWLGEIWQVLLATSGVDSVCLNGIQVRYLWSEIISKTEPSERMLNLDSTLDKLIQAWTLCHQWKIDYRHQDFDDHLDCKMFSEWAQAYYKYCKNNNWLDESVLPDVLITKVNGYLQNKSLKKIILYEFGDIPPQHQQLLNAFENNNVEIMAYKNSVDQSYRIKTQCDDAKAEIQSALCWALQAIDEDVEQSVSIVVPNLQGQLRTIESAIKDAALLRYQTVSKLSDKINISAGHACSDYSLVASIFLYFTIGQGEPTLEEWSQFLRSPFYSGAASEQHGRIQLDAALRKTLCEKLSLQIVINYAKQSKHDLSRLIDLLSLLQNKRRSFSIEQSMDAWLVFISEYLQALGWPGEQILTSEEYQLVQTINRCLASLSCIDRITEKVSFSQARALIRHQLNNTVFHPESPQAPIQILGLLEAAGTVSSKRWVMGMSADLLPQAANPNPFIPYALQKKLATPSSTPERELHYSRNILETYFRTSEQLIFSYPSVVDEQPVIGSYLLDNVEEVNIDTVIQDTSERLSESIFYTAKIESFIDDYCTNIQVSEGEKGGTGIFKDQSSCGFKAFAKYRLSANMPEMITSRLDALARGNIVHAALEAVWNRLENSEVLNHTSDKELLSFVHDAIKSAFKIVLSNEFLKYNYHYLLLEEKCLSILLINWLNHEKTRPYFSIHSQEEASSFSLKNIEFRLKADRIDQLENGQKLIVDYKTGYVTPSNWYGERPEEPQLPLYALSIPENLAGITFAQVKANDMSFKGIMHHSSEISGIKEIGNEWQDLISAWTDSLTKIAEEYTQGDARVLPRHASSCLYCNYSSLCRISDD